MRPLKARRRSIKSEEALNILGRYKTPEEQLKAHVEARKKLGENPITVPGPNASDEEWANFYKAIGRPESPDKYQFTEVEGMEGNPEMDKAFAETAHKYGLTPNQADGIRLFLANYAKEWEQTQEQTIEQVKAETEKMLKQEYGQNYEANITAADKALRQVFGEEAAKKLAAAGLHVDPDIVKGFVKLSQVVGEDKLKGIGEGGAAHSPMTREELEELMSRPEYYDPARRDPALVRKVEEGFKQLAGNA